MGVGEGLGEGLGHGHGDGKGEDDTRMIVGGGVAICITVCFFLLGLPMMIAGGVMIWIFSGDNMSDTGLDSNIPLIVGIVLLVVSVLFLIGGIAVSICICCCKKKDTPQTMVMQGGTVLSPPPPAYAVPQGSYPPPPGGSLPGQQYPQQYQQQTQPDQYATAPSYPSQEQNKF